MHIVGVLDAGAAAGDLGPIVDRAARLVDDGADLVDVDAVTTPVGPLDVATVVRLVRRLADEGLPVGVTTTSADVVVGAVDAGAVVVCDPSGSSLDRFMPRIVAAAGVPYVLGQSVTDVGARPATPTEFRELATRRVRSLQEAGVSAEQIVLDSGFGQFSHGDVEWELLDHLERLHGSGHPVFVDASWQALFTTQPPPGDGDTGWDEVDATAVGVCVVAARARAWGVRVSNVVRASAVLRGRSTKPRHGFELQSR